MKHLASVPQKFQGLNKQGKEDRKTVTDQAG